MHHLLRVQTIKGQAYWFGKTEALRKASNFLEAATPQKRGARASACTHALFSPATS